MKLWEHPPHYAGATWEGRLVAPVTQHRDSDPLERSNFDAFRAALAELPPWDPDPDPDEDDISSRTVVRERHSLCGWVEWIAIHPRDTAAVALGEATEAKLEDYSVLDEDLFSQYEDAENAAAWKNCYNERGRIEHLREHGVPDHIRTFADLLACVRGGLHPGTL